MRQREDLTGKRFGRLVVLKKGEDYVSPKGEKKARWICQCDCGNVVLRSSNLLKKGESLSCGCYRKDALREIKTIDLVGKKFGRLVVTRKDTDSHKKGTFWICQCDCGNVVSVSAGALKSDNTKSCGCVQSHGEMIVLDILKSFGLKEGKDFIRHKTFEELTGIKGGLLSYDYAIIDSGEILSLLECQGQQHYFPVELFGGEKQFEIQKEHDKRKRVFAQKNELPLICLRYSLSEKDIKEVLEELIFGEKLPHGE